MIYMPGWIKYFNAVNPDGYYEENGLDVDVETGLASWSKGQLADIIAVDVSDGHTLVTVRSLPSSKWWQCDQCISTFAGLNRSGVTHIQNRIIEKQIESCDVGVVYKHITNEFSVMFWLPGTKGWNEEKVLEITLQDVGKWLVVSLHTDDHQVSISISDVRV